MKYCCDCNTTKKITNFCKSKNRKDGYSHICRQCAGIRNRKWLEINKEYIREKERQWIKDNHDFYYLYQLIRYYAELERFRKQSRKYRYKRMYGKNYEKLEKILDLKYKVRNNRLKQGITLGSKAIFKKGEYYVNLK